MRAIWSGSLSFGLINIPVKLYSGEQSRGIDINLLHDEDLQPIRFARFCKSEEKEVPWEHIVKGVQVDEGFHVILTAEDFERADAKKTNSIELLTFTHEREVDPIYFEKFYFLEPGKGAGKAYALLLAALGKTNRVGVAKFVLRQREHLAVLRPKGKILLLHQLRFAEEIRSAEDLTIPDVKSTAKELKMATSLIEAQSETFTPENYRDTYTEELKRVIAAKARGEKPKRIGKKPKPTEVTELVTLLQKSLKMKRTSNATAVRR